MKDTESPHYTFENISIVEGPFGLRNITLMPSLDPPGYTRPFAVAEDRRADICVADANGEAIAVADLRKNSRRREEAKQFLLDLCNVTFP